jgi:hypothetical protein
VAEGRNPLAALLSCKFQEKIPESCAHSFMAVANWVNKNVTLIFWLLIRNLLLFSNLTLLKPNLQSIFQKQRKLMLKAQWAWPIPAF